jgi:hypothetical protein
MPNDLAREIVFDVLEDEPISTSDLYERVGYSQLMRAGLIPYHAFRQTLVELEAQGRATAGTDEDGATVWSRV